MGRGAYRAEAAPHRVVSVFDSDPCFTGAGEPRRIPRERVTVEQRVRIEDRRRLELELSPDSGADLGVGQALIEQLLADLPSTLARVEPAPSHRWLSFWRHRAPSLGRPARRRQSPRWPLRISFSTHSNPGLLANTFGSREAIQSWPDNHQRFWAAELGNGS